MPDPIQALGYPSPSEQILIPPDRLHARIVELGKQLDVDYAGKDLVMVCILKGGVLFLTDLMRAVHIPHSIDFMAVSSYGVGARESTGVVRIIMDLERDIRDKHVLDRGRHHRFRTYAGLHLQRAAIEAAGQPQDLHAA